MARIAAICLVIGGTLVAAPAAAQFGGDSPPRPPSDVPGGGFPRQPPPVGYPGANQGQYYPSPGQGQQNPTPPPPPPQARTPSGIQSQPLAPPPGGTAAPPPAQRARTTPPGGPQQPQQANQSPPGANPPPPADTTPPPPPDDTIVTEMPAQKIPNNRAVFSGLDKITGRIISFDGAVGETVQFGALQVTARVCYTRPPTEATNTDAFVEVDEVTLQGEIKRIFNGWMFAASPGLHAVEHPIYDVWLTDCASPQPMQVAQPAVAPTPAQAVPAPPKPRQAAPPRPQAPIAPAAPFPPR